MLKSHKQLPRLFLNRPDLVSDSEVFKRGLLTLCQVDIVRRLIRFGFIVIVIIFVTIMVIIVIAIDIHVITRFGSDMDMR